MYDIADLYKAEVTIPIAFEVAAQAPEDLPAVVRRRVRDAMVEHHILERMVHDIRWLLLTEEKQLFPAYAGVIPARPAGAWPCIAFPRTRGGDPVSQVIQTSESGLFPAHAGVIPFRRSSRRVKAAFSPHTRG